MSEMKTFVSEKSVFGAGVFFCEFSSRLFVKNVVVGLSFEHRM